MTIIINVIVVGCFIRIFIWKGNIRRPRDFCSPLLYTPASKGGVPPNQSHRVCNCLALLQCVASDPVTKKLCLRAHIPLYLYPFLSMHKPPENLYSHSNPRDAQSKTQSGSPSATPTATHNASLESSSARSLEFLRLTALGVVGALVKGVDGVILQFLLQSEIVPLCLKIMESGTDLSSTVATFIVQKILSFEEGLNYFCATPERFYAVSSVLSSMVSNVDTHPPSARLLKHIVRCYLRLCECPRAQEAFKHCLPPVFLNDALQPQLQEDPSIKKWIGHLLTRVRPI